MNKRANGVPRCFVPSDCIVSTFCRYTSYVRSSRRRDEEGYIFEVLRDSPLRDILQP